VSKPAKPRYRVQVSGIDHLWRWEIVFLGRGTDGAESVWYYASKRAAKAAARRLIAAIRAGDVDESEIA